jgi:hypothetical protein
MIWRPGGIQHVYETDQTAKQALFAFSKKLTKKFTEGVFRVL